MRSESSVFSVVVQDTTTMPVFWAHLISIVLSLGFLSYFFNYDKTINLYVFTIVSFIRVFERKQKKSYLYQKEGVRKVLNIRKQKIFKSYLILVTFGCLRILIQIYSVLLLLSSSVSFFQFSINM